MFDSMFESVLRARSTGPSLGGASDMVARRWRARSYSFACNRCCLLVLVQLRLALKQQNEESICGRCARICCRVRSGDRRSVRLFIALVLGFGFGLLASVLQAASQACPAVLSAGSLQNERRADRGRRHASVDPFCSFAIIHTPRAAAGDSASLRREQAYVRQQQRIDRRKAKNR